MPTCDMCRIQVKRRINLKKFIISAIVIFLVGLFIGLSLPHPTTTPLKTWSYYYTTIMMGLVTFGFPLWMWLYLTRSIEGKDIAFIKHRLQQTLTGAWAVWWVFCILACGLYSSGWGSANSVNQRLYREQDEHRQTKKIIIEFENILKGKRYYASMGRERFSIMPTSIELGGLLSRLRSENEDLKTEIVRLISEDNNATNPKKDNE